MSTRSRIGMVFDDGSIKSIYCHFDGYLSYNGKILLEHYQDKDKVESLIALGAISSLGENISDVCAYHRDRGEQIVITESTNFEEFANKIDYLFEEFVYLFKDGAWNYIESYSFYKNKKIASIDDFKLLTKESVVEG